MADIIKQINVGGKTYNIDSFNSDTLEGKTVNDIVTLAQMGRVTSIFEVAESLESIDPISTTTIYLIPCEVNADGTIDSYDEYVYINGKWELIANTHIDLSDYYTKEEIAGLNHAVKGDYTSNSVASTVKSVSSEGGAVLDTTSAGAQEVTTSKQAEVTANGSATITYSKSAAETGSASGSEESNTGYATSTGSFTGTDATLNHTGSFSGTAATLDHTGSFSGKDTTLSHTGSFSGEQATLTHDVNTTTVVSAPAETGSKGEHSHEVDSHAHGADVDVITSVSLSGGSAASLSAPVVEVIKSVTASATVSGNAMYAEVEGTVLKIEAASLTSDVTLTPVTQSVVESVSFTPNVVPTLTSSAGKAAGIGSVATLTTKAAGAHTHSIVGTDVTVVTGVNNHTYTPAGTISVDAHAYKPEGTIAVEAHSYTPAGTISVDAHSYKPEGTISMASHRHTYMAPAEHIHAIASTDTTVTGTASVVVPEHDHTVSVASHTHSVTVASHTHVIEMNEHAHKTTI